MIVTLEEIRKRHQKLKENAKKYRLDNKEKINMQRKKRQAKNRESFNAKAKKWRDKNTEKVKASVKKYQQNNPDKLIVNCANYRARKFGATVYMTKKDKAKIAELYTIAKDATKLFGYNWEVDHIVPLNKAGLHKLSNLQVVPTSWNRAKRDRNSDVYWG